MKRRDSNFELLRIVAMILVLLVHVNYLSLGPVSKSEIDATPWTGFVRIFCEQLCIVCVDLFVLLSGWFGIRPTFKKLSALLFQVLFVGLLSSAICKLAGFAVPAFEIQNLIWFGQHYWFVVDYLILFAISPVLNSFCESASRREFATVVVSFFLMEWAFGWYKGGDAGHFCCGYSAISFVGLYLLAQYLRRYGGGLCALKWHHYIALYLAFTAIPALTSYYQISTDAQVLMPSISYNSPFVIAAAVSLMLMFYKFSFESRFINWLSTSTFAIFLVHMAPGVNKLYIDLFKDAYHNMNGALFIVFAIFAALVIGFACILFDKLRIVAWNQVLKIVERVR